MQKSLMAATVDYVDNFRWLPDIVFQTYGRILRTISVSQSSIV